MNSLSLKRNRFVELIQGEVQLLRILIFLKATQREKNKRLSKLINLLQENLSMEINLKSVIKIKNKIPLFLMLKLKIGIITKNNHCKLIKNHRTTSIMKKMKLMCRMILNLQRRRMNERSIHLQEAKKEILGCKDPYHILKR
jgi:hypothetical protein